MEKRSGEEASSYCLIGVYSVGTTFELPLDLVHFVIHRSRSGHFYLVKFALHNVRPYTVLHLD